MYLSVKNKILFLVDLVTWKWQFPSTKTNKQTNKKKKLDNMLKNSNFRLLEIDQ